MFVWRVSIPQKTRPFAASKLSNVEVTRLDLKVLGGKNCGWSEGTHVLKQDTLKRGKKIVSFLMFCFFFCDFGRISFG